MSLRAPRHAGRRLAVAALGLLPMLAACGGPPAPERTLSDTAGGTLTVVASTAVWGSVVRAVAGPGVRVDSIIKDPATDPHSYESTPADAAAIADADLVVANGGGYDQWIDQATETDPTVAAKTIRAFDLRADRAEENEHVWFDPAAVKGVVTQVVERLSAVEPAQAGALRERGAAFTGQVDAIAGRTGTIGAARPGAQVYSTEPIAFYLLRSAGVADATPEAFAEAIENETDPPAAALAEVGDGLAQRRVAALVFNPQTETPVVAGLRDVANRGGTPVVEITETLPAGTDYLRWFDGNRAALAGALGLPG